MVEDEPSFFELLSQVFTEVGSIGNINGRSEQVRDRVRHEVQRRRADLARVRSNFDPKVEKMREKAIKQFDKLDQAFAQAVVADATEKVWYTVSILNILAIGMCVAHTPHQIHILYTAELLFLLPIRFWMYHQRNWHYFLADLCYYVNGLLVLYLWVWPQWSALWISVFAFSFGSLAGAVILWRNSLVLQLVDKTTSSFIHLMPPLVAYCINFRVHESFKTARFPGAYSINTWNTVYSVSVTTLAYFVWQFAYHYFITVRRAEKIRNGTVTSFEFMRKRYGKSRLGKFVNSLPGPLPILAFTLIQFTFQMVTMLPCPLYYMHETLCTYVLVFIFAVACYNGASYYIEVYGERFHKQVKQLQAELAKLEEKEGEEDELIPGNDECRAEEANTEVAKALDSKIEGVKAEQSRKDV